jgi:hypothetical protein
MGVGRPLIVLAGCLDEWTTVSVSRLAYPYVYGRWTARVVAVSDPFRTPALKDGTGSRRPRLCPAHDRRSCDVLRPIELYALADADLDTLRGSALDADSRPT